MIFIQEYTMSMSDCMQNWAQNTCKVGVGFNYQPLIDTVVCN